MLSLFLKRSLQDKNNFSHPQLSMMIYAHGAIDMVLAPHAAPPFNQERVLARTTVWEGGASASDGLGMNLESHGCNEQVSQCHYGVDWPPKLMNARRALHICPCTNVKRAPQY